MMLSMMLSIFRKSCVGRWGNFFNREDLMENRYARSLAAKAALEAEENTQEG